MEGRLRARDMMSRSQKSRLNRQPRENVYRFNANEREGGADNIETNPEVAMRVDSGGGRDKGKNESLNPSE